MAPRPREDYLVVVNSGETSSSISVINNNSNRITASGRMGTVESSYDVPTDAPSQVPKEAAEAHLPDEDEDETAGAVNTIKRTTVEARKTKTMSEKEEIILLRQDLEALQGQLDAKQEALERSQSTCQRLEGLVGSLKSVILHLDPVQGRKALQGEIAAMEALLFEGPEAYEQLLSEQGGAPRNQHIQQSQQLAPSMTSTTFPTTIPVVGKKKKKTSTIEEFDDSRKKGQKGETTHKKIKKGATTEKSTAEAHGEKQKPQKKKTGGSKKNKAVLKGDIAAADAGSCAAPTAATVRLSTTNPTVNAGSSLLLSEDDTTPPRIGNDAGNMSTGPLSLDATTTAMKTKTTTTMATHNDTRATHPPIQPARSHPRVTGAAYWKEFSTNTTTANPTASALELAMKKKQEQSSWIGSLW